jgi:hypothetical protein
MNINMNNNINNFYNILLESYIIFALFAIGFYILIKYILTPFQLNSTAEFAIKQLSFYGLEQLKQTAEFKNNRDNSLNKLRQTENAKQQEVDAKNKEYENKQIIILISMTVGIAVLLVIPLLFGWIKLYDINWRHLALVLMINLIIILVVEAIFIYYVIGKHTSIRFYPLFNIKV